MTTPTTQSEPRRRPQPGLDPFVDALVPPRHTFYVLDENGDKWNLLDALALLGLIADGGK